MPHAPELFGRVERSLSSNVPPALLNSIEIEIQKTLNKRFKGVLSINSFSEKVFFSDWSINSEPGYFAKFKSDKNSDPFFIKADLSFSFEFINLLTGGGSNSSISSKIHRQLSKLDLQMISPIAEDIFNIIGQKTSQEIRYMKAETDMMFLKIVPESTQYESIRFDIQIDDKIGSIELLFNIPDNHA